MEKRLSTSTSSTKYVALRSGAGVLVEEYWYSSKVLYFIGIKSNITFIIFYRTFIEIVSGYIVVLAQVLQSVARYRIDSELIQVQVLVLVL